MMRIKPLPYFNVVLAILFLLFAGCETGTSNKPIEKDGKLYGTTQGAFRHRWWNYYERGLSYAEGQFFQEALADLQSAAKQRDKDQRQARTYGMHFIDYFPHREMGVIYYETRNFEAAKTELELSVEQYPSAKALYYLDRVRKALIGNAGAHWPPPLLTLQTPGSEMWTNQPKIVISGTAADDNFVSAVSIDNVPILIEGARKRIDFSKEITLSQGRREITVTAMNLMGKTASTKIILHVDQEGPMVTVEDIAVNVERKTVAVTGYVDDTSGVDRISLNGQKLKFRKSEAVYFKEEFPRREKAITLVTADTLGNETVAKFDIPQTSTLQSCTAGLDSDRRLTAGLFGPDDTQPPNVDIKDLTEEQIVFLDRIYIAGQVNDDNGIENLTLNQTPILTRKGKSVFFSHLATLQEGENHIIVAAKDLSGNETQKMITIIRNVPQALKLAERLKVSVLPFERQGELSPAANSFHDNLTDALVEEDRFQVVERNKLELILQEQKLSGTALIDRNTAIRLGKLVAAKAIITGSIIETRNGIEIVGRMIDTETSEIIDTEDVYDEIKDLQAVIKMAKGMAIKFHMEFPLVGGIVLIRKGNDIFTDIGENKIALKRRLIVYREEKIVHPVTGTVLGADNIIIGNAIVTQVLPDMSKAEIVNGNPDEIDKMHMVITE